MTTLTLWRRPRLARCLAERHVGQIDVDTLLQQPATPPSSDVISSVSSSST